ncbi:MAG TPA: hypothetical protein VFR11_14670 [Micromonosporaceae bacterium]|jgi:hypothetical protein|nr:hypothetical protein [Micromonosporaceae bacterium]
MTATATATRFAAGVSIAWADIGRVIGISLLVGVGLVVVFAIGVRVLSYRAAADGPHTPTRAVWSSPARCS